MDFSDLTEEQRQAVLHDGNLRLISCPGGGKTLVIAHRVAHWLKEGLDPRKTLCITFTRKAAKEMKDRIKKVAGDASKGVQAATFHSFFLSFLIRYCKVKDQDGSLTLIDDISQRKIIEAIITRLEFEIDLEETISSIELSKNNLTPPNPKTFEGIRGVYEMEMIYDLYQRYLREYDLLDFTEILVRSHNLLSVSPAARGFFRKRLDHLSVDEGHDINLLQFELMRLITGDGEKARLTVVGDPNQSIYGFRGSRPDYILAEFEKHFVNTQTLHLTRNFRSSGMIVQAASTVLEGNIMTTNNPPGDKIIVLKCWNEEDQAERVSGIVSDLIGEGTKPKDMAILFRKNCQADALAWELFVRNVPFEVREENRRRRKESISFPFLAQAILISSSSAPALAFMLLLLWKFISLTKRREKVALMTMHQSKGLEWPVVFLTNQKHEEHFFGDDEEEQRLFYVAVTRARERIYLSHFGYPNLNLANLIQRNPDLVQKRHRQTEDGEARGVSVFR